METELRVPITFRDAMPHDLERLSWSGGDAHLRALAAALEQTWAGEVVLLVGEVPTGVLVACGAAKVAVSPPELWMLSVDPTWQGLGVGTALIAALEARLRECGADSAGLSVEHDNPRARALYERLGYLAHDETRVESWPVDSGARHVTVTTHLVKLLRPGGAEAAR